MPSRKGRIPWKDPGDAEEDCERWRNATPHEKGMALVDLLGLVDAIGRFPEPRRRWPGFPPPRALRSRDG
jgi:hypothetical protein